MNIEMYERSLIPVLRSVDQELEKLNFIHSGLRNSCDQAGKTSEFLIPLQAQLLAFTKAERALMEAITLRGAEIGAEKGLLARACEWMMHRLNSMLSNRSRKP
jgi:hypothetical protein